MGDVRARVRINNGNGGRTEEVDMLVDTGSSHTVLPAELLHQLGVVPNDSDVFAYADGRRERLDIGEALISVEGRSCHNKIVFGKDHLLGTATLQELRLIPDTTHHKLIPAPPLRL